MLPHNINTSCSSSFIPSGADVNSDDGIYSKYFLMLNGAGRYSVNVHVQGEERIAQVALRRGGHAPQYTKNGNKHLTMSLQQSGFKTKVNY